MYRNRGRDPYWLKVRYDGMCGSPGCGQVIRRGEEAFYYPNTKTLLAKKCGHADDASRDFESHRFDEPA